MGEKYRTIIVHAFDDKDEDHDIGFSMSGYGVHKDEITCDKAKDKTKPKMKKSDAHRIVFELANRSSKNLRFPDNAKDAMWVSDDDQDCPKSAKHQDNIVKAIDVLDDGERLEVKNFNKVEGRHKFALIFIDADDTSVPKKGIPYDPIWANQNGGASEN